VKVVFDTNVVVSASFWRGKPFDCLAANAAQFPGAMMQQRVDPGMLLMAGGRVQYEARLRASAPRSARRRAGWRQSMRLQSRLGVLAVIPIPNIGSSSLLSVTP
jgi:hypothetical protein